MKIIVLLLCQLFLSSCSTTSAISAFLEIDHNKSDKVIIFDEKIDPIVTISILQGRNFHQKQLPSTKYYTWQEIEQLKSQHSKQQMQVWEVKDFLPSKVKVISMPSSPLSSQYGRNSSDSVYYKFSEPILSENKKTVSFYVAKEKRFGATLLSEVVVMQKINGVWQIVERLESLDLN
jgi:hypothetical protein